MQKNYKKKKKNLTWRAADSKVSSKFHFTENSCKPGNNTDVFSLLLLFFCKLTVPNDTIIIPVHRGTGNIEGRLKTDCWLMQI